jgi:hypothetical protein
MAKLKKTRSLNSKWVFLVGALLLVLCGLGWYLFIRPSSNPSSSNLQTTPDKNTPSNHEVGRLFPPVESSGTVDPNTLHACVGNLTDECIATPSIDFWPTGSEASSNPDYANIGEPKEIMGRIVSNNGNALQIKTASGRVFNIEYPINALENFNKNRAPYYKLQVETGDMIYVEYRSTGSNPTIRTSEIFKTSLILTGNVKAGGTHKY